MSLDSRPDPYLLSCFKKSHSYKNCGSSFFTRDYGGHSSSVTVFGVSSGSMAISAMLTMEDSMAPFQRSH